MLTGGFVVGLTFGLVQSTLYFHGGVIEMRAVHLLDLLLIKRSTHRSHTYQ